MPIEFKVTKVEPVLSTYLHGTATRVAFEYAYLNVQMALPGQRLAEGLVLKLADGGLYAVCSTLEEGGTLVKKLSSREDPFNHVLRRRAGKLRGEGYVYGEICP